MLRIVATGMKTFNPAKYPDAVVTAVPIAEVKETSESCAIRKTSG